MNSGKIYLFLIIFLSCISVDAQKFQILNKKKSISVPFQLVNNLMVIKAEINGMELSFLFDSGVDKTILFNLKITDSLEIRNAQKINLHGLGGGDPIPAIRSRGNQMRVKNLINPSQMIYILLDNQFDLSAKMGMDINGIIGGDLFRDFIVKINYSSKKIIFYDPLTYEYKKCKDCLTLPLDFFMRKPLVNVSIENDLKERIDVKLLIDSGGGDALWLFENTSPGIKVPQKYFKDHLGKGLSGDIFGKRSLMDKLIIGNFVLEDVIVAYPDSLYIAMTQQDRERNGTIGANILSRFHVIFDYPNKKITLRKNAANFKTPFYYNKSGIEVVHGGEMLVRERRSNFIKTDGGEGGESITQVIFSYGLAYRPSYQITLIRDNSPAKIAGLRIGDVFLKINGRIAYDLKLEEIVEILSGRSNKKIHLLIDRGGKQIKYSFHLKDML